MAGHDIVYVVRESASESGRLPETVQPHSRLLELPDGPRLLILKSHLLPRERRSLGQACRALSDDVASTCEVLALADDMAQHVLNSPLHQHQELPLAAADAATAIAPAPSSGPTPSAAPDAGLNLCFLDSLLQRFPNARALRVACRAQVLTLVALEVLASEDTSLPGLQAAAAAAAAAAAVAVAAPTAAAAAVAATGATPPVAAAEGAAGHTLPSKPPAASCTSRIDACAKGLATEEPRKAAVLLACIVRHHVTCSRVSEALAAMQALEQLADQAPPAGDSTSVGVARLQHQQRQGYPPVCETLDFLCVGACHALQAHDPESAAAFAGKARSPVAKAAAWRWLLYFLALPATPPASAETACRRAWLAHGGASVFVQESEARLALQQLSRTCLPNVRHAICDTPGLREQLQAERDAGGSEADFLQRSKMLVKPAPNYSICLKTTFQDGVVERDCTALVANSSHVEALRLAVSLHSAQTACEVWDMLAAAVGAQDGWECAVTPAVESTMLRLIPELPEARRTAAYGGLVRLLAGHGSALRTRSAAALVGQGSGGEAALWEAVFSSYCLDSDAVVQAMSDATLDTILQVARRMHESCSAAASAYVAWCRGMAARGRLPQAYCIIAADVPTPSIAPMIPAAVSAAAHLFHRAVWMCLMAHLLKQRDVGRSLLCAAAMGPQQLLGPSIWASASSAAGAVFPPASLWRQLCNLVATSTSAAMRELLQALAGVECLATSEAMHKELAASMAARADFLRTAEALERAQEAPPRASTAFYCVS